MRFSKVCSTKKQNKLYVVESGWKYQDIKSLDVKILLTKKEKIQYSDWKNIQFENLTGVKRTWVFDDEVRTIELGTLQKYGLVYVQNDEIIGIEYS